MHPKDRAQMMAYLTRPSVNKRSPMAGGGMLVQPSADGSRPGYAGTKVEENIRLKGNLYNVEVKRGGETFYKSFSKKKLGDKEALEAAKKFKAEKTKIHFKPGKQNPMFGPGLSEKEYNKLYKEKTRTLTEEGKVEKERKLKIKK